MFEAAGPAAERGGPDPEPQSSYRILVAEDHRPISDIITKVLREEGYWVDTCADGEATLRRLAASIYDLVVLDFKLPLKNGAKVIRELRAQGNLVPILFTSCRTGDELETFSGSVGRVRFLPKPFTLEDLRAAVLATAAC